MSVKRITVTYYAQLREQADRSHESIETQAATPTALYAELCERYHFSLPAESVKVAVHDAFASWQVPLQDGDAIQFIPPVAGG
jgi:molybdopterin converting factor small subunit